MRFFGQPTHLHGVYEAWNQCAQLQRPHLKRNACPPLEGARGRIIQGLEILELHLEKLKINITLILKIPPK